MKSSTSKSTTPQPSPEAKPLARTYKPGAINARQKKELADARAEIERAAAALKEEHTPYEQRVQQLDAILTELSPPKLEELETNYRNATQRVSVLGNDGRSHDESEARAAKAAVLKAERELEAYHSGEGLALTQKEPLLLKQSDVLRQTIANQHPRILVASHNLNTEIVAAHQELKGIFVTPALETLREEIQTALLAFFHDDDALQSAARLVIGHSPLNQKLSRSFPDTLNDRSPEGLLKTDDETLSIIDQTLDGKFNLIVEVQVPIDPYAAAVAERHALNVADAEREAAERAEIDEKHRDKLKKQRARLVKNDDLAELEQFDAEHPDLLAATAQG